MSSYVMQNSNFQIHPREKAVQAFRRLLVLVIAVFASAAAFAKDMPTVDPTELIAKYGKPDRVSSTEYDKPRPPFMTRMLEYRKEGVRIALLANALMGSSPPYSSWKLMGFQDIASNNVIPQEEAERRLAGRMKKK